MYQYIFQYISIYIFCSLSYHESNLSLIARETMPLLVNRQLVPVAIQLKSISLEKMVLPYRSNSATQTR